MGDTSMGDVWARMSAIPGERSPGEGQRHVVLLGRLILCLIAGVLASVLERAVWRSSGLVFTGSYAAVMLGVTIVLVGAAAVNRVGYYVLAAAVVVLGCWFGVLGLFSVLPEAEGAWALIFLVIPMGLAAIFFPRRFVIGLMVATVAVLVGLVVFWPGTSLGDVPIVFVTVTSALLVVGVRHRDRIEDMRHRRLASSEARYRTIVETAREGIWILGPDDCTEFVNARMAEMLGFPIQEILGSPFSRYVEGEWIEAALIRARGWRLGGASRYEFCLCGGEGKPLWALFSVTPRFDEQGAYRGVLIMATDISATKAMVRALEESRDFAERVIASVRDGFVILDDQGFHLDVNGAFCEMTGFPRAQLVGTRFPAGYWPGAERWQIEDLFDRASREPRVEEEVAFVTRAGAPLPVLISPSFVSDAEGKVVSRFAIIRDLREQKRAAREVVRRDAVLEAVRVAAARFLAGGDFAAGIESAIEGLGRAAAVDRVCVFERHGGPDGTLRVSQRCEWCAPGVSSSPRRDRLYDLDYQRYGFGPWEEAFRHGSPVMGDVRDFPPEIQSYYRGGDVKSVLLVPVIVRETLWGVISYDECRGPRSWSAMTVDALDAAARMLAAAILRDRSERAIRESEQMVRALLNGPCDYALVTDRAGTVLDVNETLAASYSVRRESIVGRTVWTLFRGSVRRRGRGILDEVLRDRRPLRVEEWVAGGWRDTLVLPILDGEGEVQRVAVLARDVTEQKRLAEEFRQRGQLLARVMEASPVAIVVVDRVGTITMANARVAEIVGRSKEEIVGVSAFSAQWNLVDDEGRRAAGGGHLFEAVKHVQGMVRDVRQTFCRADGRRVVLSMNIAPLFDADGQFEGAVGVVEDVTERVRVQSELEENRRQLEELFEDAPVGYHELDLAGCIRRINRTELELLGRVSDEMLGHPVWEFVVEFETSRQAVKARLAGLAQDASAPFERTYVHRDGHRIPVLVKDAILHDGKGNVTGIRSTIQDISERRRAEEQLEAYQRGLRTLASELSLAEEHERRRIASFLHDQIGQSLAAVRMKFGALRVAVLPASASSLVEQVHSLLETAIGDTRALTFELSPPILYELGLEPTLDWLAERFSEEHGLRVVFEDDGNEKPLDEDVSALLYRAVRELLFNVVKHANATGARVSVARDERWIRVVVDDNGIGFAREGAGSTQPGGFGLFNVRERIEYIGGRMTVETGTGRGTRIGLWAPLSALAMTKKEPCGHDSNTVGG